ncbi:MAG TPA: hypothetical protein DCX32_00605 [Candidatus Moranbacteria bacterium]|nr:MAG: hypothetical protein UW87_C0006G0031 [Candidatus Moranbacteria bacterium GW2011_GWC2_45_10]KKT95555.1 MAG: hypothetical protein UW95_C0001G0119 [Parcubacteria group bacterium GW2011_GWC1_45_14]HAV11038.1 hypothetical protein [Candidatus Moranbacteria bacterium]
MQGDISEIEEYVRKIFVESPHVEDPDRKKLLQNFWENHTKEVVDLSLELAKKYGADREIVHLGALFHDFSLAYDSEPHDEVSADKAFEFLIVNWFNRDVAEKVRDIILKHRCKKFIPETLEEKIVSTADAIAHFIPAFYKGAAEVAREDYAEMIRGKIDKLEDEYERKVFFEDEKKILKKYMKEFKEKYYYKISNKTDA